MLKFLYIAVFLFSSIFSLESQPWFGDVYEFHFVSKYSFFRYRNVNGAILQFDNPSNCNLVYFDLSFAPSLNWSIDSDLEFISTPRQDFGFRSVAFQARYLLKDDIIGDPLSVSLGCNFRVMSNESLRDVTNLYHSDVDFEFNLALGKEFARRDNLRFRFWAYTAFGVGTSGSPWFRLRAALEGNSREETKWALFLDGMRGFGNKTLIDLYDFDGYGRIKERNLDLGFRYGYRLGVFGTLSFEYSRRILAKRCPENVNLAAVTYMLPFSF